MAKQRGRPRGILKPAFLHLRVPEELEQRIGNEAKRLGMPRSEFCRAVLAKGTALSEIEAALSTSQGNEVCMH